MMTEEHETVGGYEIDVVAITMGRGRSARIELEDPPCEVLSIEAIGNGVYGKAQEGGNEWIQSLSMSSLPILVNASVP